MCDILKKKQFYLRRLLKLEELYSSPLSKQLPIDIECTQLGRDASALLSALVDRPDNAKGEKDEPVSPYCDMSFRLLSRLADALMQKHDFESCEVEAVQEAVERMNKFQNAFYQKRIAAEKHFFLDKP